MLSNLLLLPWPEFTGIKPMHVAMSLRKSTFIDLWEQEYDLLDATCHHRFRDINDVNPWLAEFWQMARGDFYPRKAGDLKYYSLSPKDRDNKDIYRDIAGSKYKLMCINDGYVNEKYDGVKEHLCRVMEEKFPGKCSFER